MVLDDTLTPGKYYGGQLDNDEKCQYLIGCDWLEMSLRGELDWLSKLDEHKRGEYLFSRNTEIRSRFFNHVEIPPKLTTSFRGKVTTES